MKKIEKKYMFNQCLYTLIQTGSGLQKTFSQFFKFLTFIFLNVILKHDCLRSFAK